jgi:hypothetical protein
MMEEARYRNVPVDAETYRMVKALAQAKGFGERGQGAVVRALVRGEYEKLAAVKQVPAPGENPNAGELEFRAELREKGM